MEKTYAVTCNALIFTIPVRIDGTIADLAAFAKGKCSVQIDSVCQIKTSPAEFASQNGAVIRPHIPMKVGISVNICLYTAVTDH